MLATAEPLFELDEPILLTWVVKLLRVASESVMRSTRKAAPSFETTTDLLDAVDACLSSFFMFVSRFRLCSWLCHYKLEWLVAEYVL